MAKIEIKRLPPGEARGARDLQRWASRRRVGRSGVDDKAEEAVTRSEQEMERRKAHWRKKREREQQQYDADRERERAERERIFKHLNGPEAEAKRIRLNAIKFAARMKQKGG
jgi:hypothetical protein